MLTVFGCPNSRSLRTVWALEEAGADYDYVFVDLFKGAGRQPAFLAINPAGKVPALRLDDGSVITETGAIGLWIAEHFPDADLLPTEASARTQALRWLCFCLTELEQPLWTIAKHRFALPEKRRLPAIEDTARWEFNTAAALLARHLEATPWLAGDRFSLADIFASHCLAWAKSAKVSLEGAVLPSYLERNWARPSLQRALTREAAEKEQQS
ncbi:glutathione S-transferase family protein [Denitromonas iodatirespirans]|uniref:Glutathione S-transferase family protein n=1 Tax=Denitromonas iodatirespirans TaxID=2795389 RepID=A0A944D7N0_DENI1|nr:glutathione S-transferase family protein [Denitromonas iodatirespirans]MBT0959811.1 glutathione S-transferase family protein [Denitromonas iodatirespirans]